MKIVVDDLSRIQLDRPVDSSHANPLDTEIWFYMV